MALKNHQNSVRYYSFVDYTKPILLVFSLEDCQVQDVANHAIY
jgi:hypothetical protein